MSEPANSSNQPPAFENTNRWDTRQLVTMSLMCAIGVLLSFLLALYKELLLWL